MEETIFALSSGAPPAAIAIVRISGSMAAAVLTAMAGGVPEARQATLRWLVDPGTGERLDQAIILWFPGPRSATGEDLAELHLHGGRAVIDATSATLGAFRHVRAAVAGEFTHRAYSNGVMNLSGVEGLADLLAAETQSQRRQAQLLAGGAMERLAEDWQDRLLALCARIEAHIEYGDEDGTAFDQEAIAADLTTLRDEMRRRLDQPPAERLRDGVRVVLAGPPNSGKSSLFNRLVGRDAAIVTPQAGTTRDLIEAPVSLDGTPFVIIDTAGLNEATVDEIERIGIHRGLEAIGSADILLWLGDADPPMHPLTIRIWPRCDLPGRHLAPSAAMLLVSVKDDVGISTVVSRLVDAARMLLPIEGEVAFGRRHRLVLQQVVADITGAERDDPVLFAEALSHARRVLNRLTGQAGVEDMLDALFSRFCVGK